jgi:hypothetical protein
MAEEGQVDTGTENTEGTTTVELTPTEQKAAAEGWQSKEDWIAAGHDEADHRSAREYLDRGELLGKIKSQSQEAKELRNMVAQLGEHNKQVYQAGYQRALVELRAKKAEAIQNGDGALVVQLDDAIDKTRDHIRNIQAAPQAAPQAQTGEAPAFTEFKQAAPWYNTDKVMQKWAHGEAIEYARELGDAATEAKIYAHLIRQAKIEFPDRVNARKGPPNPDGEGRTSGNGKSSGGGNAAFEKLMATLPEDQARAARSLVKNKILTAEKYVEDYNNIRS